MLSLNMLQAIGKSAEDLGFRVTITSEDNAKFQIEYTPEYDLTVTYTVVDGEARIETTSEGVSFSPEVLIAYYKHLVYCMWIVTALRGTLE